MSVAANTTAAMPQRCSQAISSSESHSQANHGLPGRVKENMILARYAAMRKHPIAGPNVPACIAIGQ